jgi:hypothetical protein
MRKLSPLQGKLAGIAGILIVSTAAVVGREYGDLRSQRRPGVEQRKPATADSLARILRGNNKHTNKRKAKGCVSTSGRCEVDVSIEARNVTNDVGVDTPPATDRQIAVIRNNGTFTEAKYDLKPFYEAEYLLFLKAGKPGSEARWELTEVLANGTSSRFKSGRITQCAKYSPREASDVNFFTCTLTDHSPNHRRRRGGPNSSRMSMFAPLEWVFGLIKPPAHLGIELDSPLWIACNNGCCTLL